MYAFNKYCNSTFYKPSICFFCSYFLLLVKPRAVTMKANRKVNEEDKELIVDENHPSMYHCNISIHGCSSL